MGHQTGGARRRDGQQGDVAATIALHIGVQLWIGSRQTLDERIVRFPLGIVNGESPAVACHIYRSAVSINGQALVDFNRHFDAFVAAIAQAQCGQGIALSGDAHTCTATADTSGAYLIPKLVFHVFQIAGFRVFFNFFDDAVNFFHLHVDDIVHDALGQLGMFRKFFKVETRFRGEGLFNVAVQVQRQEAAAVVGRKGNFATRVG